MQAVADSAGGQASRDQLGDPSLALGQIVGVGDERRELGRARWFEEHRRAGGGTGGRDERPGEWHFFVGGLPSA